MAFTFTSNHWPIACTFWVTAFLAGIAGSIQAPFYPEEATKKGVNQTHVGLVFATYHFTIFTTSLMFGKYIGKLGAKRMVYVGVLLMGLCAVAFGFLDYINTSTNFLMMSYIVRAIEALGHSSFKTATFAIVSKEFPDSVG